ncbi:type II toxin-antitoxin system PemK/MazF family toxin [Paraburkholderia sediminicola]
MSFVLCHSMTTAGRAAPFRVPLTFLRKKGLILLDQIRTVDKTRLVKRAGAVSDTALSNALSTLQEIFVE